MAALAEAHVVDIEQGNSDEESRRSSNAGSISDDQSCTAEIEKGRTTSCCSSLSDECSVDLELEDLNLVCVHSGKYQVKRSCRICHLSFDGSNSEAGGFVMELGCSCKNDLAAAHKHCAEAWFKIRGNKTCEICGSTAKNVSGVTEVELMEQWNEGNESAATAAPPLHHPVETRRFWQGHRFLNFLLACMVFAFVISWLFHFNVPS